jgi:stage II sporulation protein D
MGHGTSGTGSGTLRFSATEETMPDAARLRRNDPRRLIAVVVSAVLWLVVLVGAAGPVAATDPSGDPSTAPSSAPSSGPSGSPEASSSPGPSSSPDPSSPPPPPATVTFYGRGYGHGLGMSQYGARGRALAGETAPEILAHYYENTTLATLAATTPVRILLMTGFRPTTRTPAVVIALNGPFTVDGVAGTWPAGASSNLLHVTRPTAGWHLRIVSSTGILLKTMKTGSSVRIRPAATSTRLQVWSKPSVYDTYRGTIRLVGSQAGLVSVIDETTLDLYLRGVVPVEMPASWPPEALKAQAIAARSYAAAHLHPMTGSWDIRDDTSAQVYRGTRGEQSLATNAIIATSGQVLMSGTHVVTAMFHSADGGATENNENVYVSPTGARVSSPVSYLRGSSDREPDGTSYDSASPHATWQTAAYTLDQLSAVFAADPRTDVGTISALDLSHVGVSGRLIGVTLTGSLGSLTVSGEIFRSIFNTYTPAADPYMWSTLVATAPIP